MERQFSRYFDIAASKPGMTGENLLRILESRLDNVVYCIGFASSHAQARQLVGHGHFTLNGKKVDIPSIRVKPGDVITVKDSSRDNETVKAIVEANSARPVPKWLDVDHQTMQARIINLPNREDIELPVEEHLIVEYYSK
jgi:small subunit ribosomal protein S4